MADRVVDYENGDVRVAWIVEDDAPASALTPPTYDDVFDLMPIDERGAEPDEPSR